MERTFSTVTHVVSFWLNILLPLSNKPPPVSIQYSNWLFLQLNAPSRSLTVHRMLLFVVDEGFTQLYWKSNASQLPSLLWGSIGSTKARIPLGKFFCSDVLISWSTLFICAVSFWYNERHYCIAMWSHHTSGMCEKNATTFPVSYTTKVSSIVQSLNCTKCWVICLLDLYLIIPTLQVFMSCLFKVFLWYVACVGETRWGGK